MTKIKSSISKTWFRHFLLKNAHSSNFWGDLDFLKIWFRLDISLLRCVSNIYLSIMAYTLRLSDHICRFLVREKVNFPINSLFLVG